MTICLLEGQHREEEKFGGQRNLVLLKPALCNTHGVTTTGSIHLSEDLGGVEIKQDL